MEPFTDAEPFTPNELAAPNPWRCRVVTRRLEALLEKHEPDFFPVWLASMEASGRGRGVNLHWVQTLAYIAALLPLMKTEHAAITSGETKGLFRDRRTARNHTLLVRLIVKGCRRRGEFLTPAEREALLAGQEAVYRERYGDAAYHRMIEGQNPQPGQEQQEAA